jgi:hypothetical protein
VGGKNGAIVGAGLGGAAGAAIGREASGGDGKGGTAATARSVQHTAVRDSCGGKKKLKNHPGKGWAKGHNKHC